MTLLALKQTAFSNVFKLVLEPNAIAYSHSEVFSAKKNIPYRQITGMFRDSERCYIVWGGEVVHFLHEPQKQEYVDFVAQLLARITSTRGA